MISSAERGRPVLVDPEGGGARVPPVDDRRASVMSIFRSSFVKYCSAWENERSKYELFVRRAGGN